VSRYLQLIIFSLLFIFVGCAQKDLNVTTTVGKKAFEAEDFLILSALDYQQSNQPKSAIELYKLLYEKSKKITYLEEGAKVAFLSKDRNNTYEMVESGLKINSNNIELRRILIGQYLREKKYQLAKEEALSLLQLDKSVRNLNIVGTIYIQLKSYNLALKYFESAYKIETEVDILLNIVDIQYNFLNKKDDAIAYLETHIRLQTCELKTCFKLIEIYGKEKNIDGIISTYKKLYDRFKEERYAKKVVELLIYKKDKEAAIRFLDKSGYNQEMLLSIHVSSSDFKSAFIVAQRLYKSTSNLDYLGKMAIYEYESNRENMDNETLKSISTKFDKVVSKLHDPLYFNYYGYLLIDHDIDVNRGITLIKAALLKEQNSAFYLDSLAWGYYKQGKCEEAKIIMDKIVKNIDEEEVMMHYEKINECIEKRKQ